MLPQTLQFIIVMIAAAINDRLQRKIDYVEEERLILREQLTAATSGKKISFTPDQRRRLATAGKLLSPDERRKCCLIVKPGTLLDWLRKLAARKYGIEPAPERDKKRTWNQFIKAHWDSLYACDFFSVEALGITGTVRYMVFFVITLKTRSVELAGIRVDPDGEWMKQMARNLTDPVAGLLRTAKYLIHDRDPLFTEAFKSILQPQGIECVKIPAQSPNCNAYAERFVKSIRYECLNHFVFFGERHLRHVIKEYMAPYHSERFHQGLGGQLIVKDAYLENDNGAAGKVRCHSRLGGMLNFYVRDAA